MRFFYPLLFLTSLLPIIYSIRIGTNSSIINSEIFLYNNITIIEWIAALLITILIIAFGRKIYKWDVNLVYGEEIKKLDLMITEMEKLKNE